MKSFIGNFQNPLLLVVYLVVFTNCSQDRSRIPINSPDSNISNEIKPKQEYGEEPPLFFGDGDVGDMIRSATLVDLDPSKEIIEYEVLYPSFDLKSNVVIGFGSRAMHEEVFAKKWKIVFNYDELWNEHRKVPAKIIIYGYNSNNGTYDKKINEYNLLDVKSGVGQYRDMFGKMRLIRLTYFILTP